MLFSAFLIENYSSQQKKFEKDHNFKIPIQLHWEKKVYSAYVLGMVLFFWSQGRNEI